MNRLLELVDFTNAVTNRSQVILNIARSELLESHRMVKDEDVSALLAQVQENMTLIEAKVEECFESLKVIAPS